MRFDEGLGDGEPKAGPPARTQLREAVKNRLSVLERHSRTLIGDAQNDVGPAALAFHEYHTTGGSVTGRVVEQVDEHLTHEDAIDVDEGEGVEARLFHRVIAQRRTEGGQ